MVKVAPHSGYFLAGITFNGQEVMTTTIDLSSGGGPLVVTLRAGGGTLRGTVTADGVAHVVVIPAAWEPDSSLEVPSSAVGKDQGFEVLNIRPGVYHVAALGSALDPGNPTLLQRIKENGLVVNIDDATSATVTLSALVSPDPVR